MPFELNVSNDLHALAGRMKIDVEESGRKLDPFQPQFILTQTEGMKTWLQHLLATELGVAANLEFLQPGNLVSRLQYYLLGGPEKEILSRDEMCWGIYALLDENEFKEKFPEQEAYFFNDDIRRIAFARKLADLFDQYQVYRWRTVTEWNKFLADDLKELTDWQAYIWCALRTRFKMEGFDRVDLADKLIAKLESEEGSAICERIPQIHLFGIAVVTPFFLRIFHSLSRHVEIRMYLINPAPLNTGWMIFLKSGLRGCAANALKISMSAPELLREMIFCSTGVTSFGIHLNYFFRTINSLIFIMSRRSCFQKGQPICFSGSSILFFRIHQPGR